MAARKKSARKRATASKAAQRRPPRPAARRKPAPGRAARTVRRPRALKARSQPETLRLRAAAPSLTVDDIDRSLAFYRDVLGFFPGERWEQDGCLRAIELKAGAVSFYLGQDDWKKGRERTKGEGFRVYCTTSQDIDELAAKVKAAGATLDQEPTDQPWGARDFALTDPDGFKITISSDQ
jgi:catechol 2,3-dioxygenase-like lactoylglutathione lyase family enzyme